ncbi:MAG TPA: Rrf2 family transcriptional regulator [Acidimicrobiales bacterium]
MRLEISRKADLATRTLLELARSGRRSKASELAAQVGTTPGFLSQVVAPLAAQGWVRSEPGPTGGYVATVDLDRVSVLDVIEAVEGPTDTGRCVLEDKACAIGHTCALHVPWLQARAHLLSDLADTPLSSIGTPGAKRR